MALLQPGELMRCLGHFIPCQEQFGVALNPVCIGCVRKSDVSKDYQWISPTPQDGRCEYRFLKGIDDDKND